MKDVARGRILFGGDYNPEQWPEEVWADDVRLMKAAGVTSVTLGVFAWAKIEPRPGAREFGWLDRLMDLMAANDIGVVLATPTTSPPPWMGKLYPETLPRDDEGNVIWWGSRQHFSHSSKVYRDAAVAIAGDLAARYGSHPALRLWHINNEFVTFDYGDEAVRGFRDWLRSRYQTISALNDAWGTAFWGQRYDDWDEIVTPRRTQTLKNPSQVLDFRRFTSDAWLDCFRAERDVIRRHSPQIPVTTNFIFFYPGQDCWHWAGEEDVVSVDIYPDPGDPQAGQYNAMVADMTRSEASGPWMLMEQAAGRVNWRTVNRPKPTGLNRLHSLQSVARGADAVCYFQWRQSRQGAERFHSAMLTHAGERGRVFQEVMAIGNDLAAIGAEVSGHDVPAEVAILHDWSSWWAGEGGGRPSELVDYVDVVQAWHAALWSAGITTDFAPPTADLSKYKLVVIPQLYLMTDDAIASLRQYVEGGGHVASGFFTGVADQDDRIRAGGMDATLRTIFGIDVLHEWWPLEKDEQVDCGDFTGRLWSEEIEAAADAEVVARYTSGELADAPAVLRRGPALYISTLPDPAALRSLLSDAATRAGVRPVLDDLPPTVEAVRRGEVLFLLNHATDPVELPLAAGSFRDLLTGDLVTGSITLPRYGVAVLQRPKQLS